MNSKKEYYINFKNTIKNSREMQKKEDIIHQILFPIDGDFSEVVVLLSENIALFPHIQYEEWVRIITEQKQLIKDKQEVKKDMDGSYPIELLKSNLMVELMKRSKSGLILNKQNFLKQHELFLNKNKFSEEEYKQLMTSVGGYIDENNYVIEDIIPDKSKLN